MVFFLNENFSELLEIFIINYYLFLGSMEMWKMHQYPESQPDQGG